MNEQNDQKFVAPWSCRNPNPNSRFDLMKLKGIELQTTKQSIKRITWQTSGVTAT